MPLQSERGIDITPGNYKGEIVKSEIVEREKTVRKGGHETRESIYYLECDVRTNDRESILKVSYPAKITPQSALGRFLDRFDMLPPEGEDWDEKSLVGLKGKYVVKPDGQFVRIDPETFAPIS